MLSGSIPPQSGPCLRLDSCRTMRHDVTLSRAQIVLCPIGPEHVTPEYVSWLNDPLVTAQTEARFAPSDPVAVRQYLSNTLEAPDAMMWRVLSAGQHVGNIRLSSINHRHRRAAVAILLGSRRHWGQGIGSTAIDLVSAHAFSALAVGKLSAGIYETNPASRRAFEKAGFYVEATLRRHALVDGRFVDVWQMARFSTLDPQAAR